MEIITGIIAFISEALDGLVLAITVLVIVLGVLMVDSMVVGLVLVYALLMLSDQLHQTEACCLEPLLAELHPITCIIV